jgi:hypothetical protein
LPAEFHVSALPDPEAEGDATPAMAQAWSELRTSDHLVRAHAEELRRRQRGEERRLTGRDDRGHTVTH